MDKRKHIAIAVDAMGGDAAPKIVIQGVDLAAARLKNAQFLIYGNQNVIAPLLLKYNKAKSKSTCIHTEESIDATIKPSQALRIGKHSSMTLAIKAVKDKKADAIVSAGNTGALMALAKITLRMLPTITRPAIVSPLPTTNGEVIMLDLGANVHCDSKNLIQFAYMGHVYAKCLWNKNNPSVGLLNVGSEDSKGHEELQRAAQFLRHEKNGIEFYGFIEGDDINKGTVDVIVCDGFTGNIALKTIEGAVIMLTTYLERCLRASPFTRIGSLLLRPALRRMKRQIDPRLYNGAMLVGLNGVVVKSHGGTDALGFAHALYVAHELASQNYNQRVKTELNGHAQAIQAAAQVNAQQKNTP